MTPEERAREFINELYGWGQGEFTEAHDAAALAIVIREAENDALEAAVAENDRLRAALQDALDLAWETRPR